MSDKSEAVIPSKNLHPTLCQISKIKTNPGADIFPPIPPEIYFTSTSNPLAPRALSPAIAMIVSLRTSN